MKIALLGYGKMGQTIDRMATADGHEVMFRINKENRYQLTSEDLKQVDVVIEFSQPESAVENITFALESGVPIVSGTTGWLDQLGPIKAMCDKKLGAFLYASNFSIGVNLFFAINKYVARLMEAHPSYHVELKEVHHTQKLDAPSGTGITLAEDIIKAYPNKEKWVNDTTEVPNEIGILSERVEGVPGTHSINYESAVDTIRLEHVAHSREGFARGAILAASWIIGKQGFFGMEDVLELNKNH